MRDHGCNYPLTPPTNLVGRLLSSCGDNLFRRSYQESFRRSYKLALWSYEELHKKLSRKLRAKLELASSEARISFRRSCKLALWSYEKLHANLLRKLQAKLELASGEAVLSYEKLHAKLSRKFQVKLELDSGKDISWLSMENFKAKLDKLSLSGEAIPLRSCDATC